MLFRTVFYVPVPVAKIFIMRLLIIRASRSRIAEATTVFRQGLSVVVHFKFNW